MSNSQFSVCVYCGARSGIEPAYKAAGTELGKAIAENGWRLVYGAGDVGIMGAVAKSAAESGAATLGVIPTHLLSAEAPHRLLDQNRIITETMHERKKVMLMNADAVAVLPGGAGSLDEFFEVLTWAQLGLHAKPIFLVDISGYWQPLVTLMDHVVAQGFADPSVKSLVQVTPSVETLVAGLREAASDAQL